MRVAGRARPGRRVAVAMAALLLTGCAQNAPGVAAQVGEDRITDKQVDDLAEALCVLSTGAQQGGGPVPTQQMRRQALQILLDIELADDLVDPESGRVRLARLYPRSIVKDNVRTILVPRPTTAPVAGQPLRDEALLAWAREVVDTVIDREPAVAAQ